MNWLWLSVAVLALILFAVGFWGAWVALGDLSHMVEKGAESLRHPDFSRLDKELSNLRLHVEGLPSIWEDHAKRAKKAAERERYYSRTQRVDSDDEEFEAERFADNVPDRDAERSDVSGMQPVRNDVAPPSPVPPGREYIARGWQRKLGMS